MKLRSIELRLTLWYSAMLLTGFTVFALLLWLTVSAGIRDGVDQLLEQRASQIQSGLEAEVADDLEEDPEDEVQEEIPENLVELVRLLPESHLARIREADGEDIVLPAEGSLSMGWLPSGSARLEDSVLGDVGYRVLTTRVQALDRVFDVQLASSLSSLTILRRRFVSLVLVIVPVALVVCFVGGWILSRAALTPLDRLADRVAEVDVRSLQTEIPVPDTGDALERLSRSFNDMLSRLSHSIEKIEQFSADASHELRSPLAVIKTTAELALRRKRTTQEYRSDLQEIQSEVDSLSELVDVLLSLARSDEFEKTHSSGAVLQMEVDLRAIAERVFARMRSEVQAQGVELRLELASSPAIILANEPAIRRLIASLVENARAHTDSGWIAVAVHEKSDGYELSVADSGEGIPPGAVAKVFDRFYRVDRSRSRRSGRFGLGLAIVRRIAELHNARIDLESRLGEGSTFRVTFPPASPS